MSKTLHTTRALCPRCDEVVDARIVEKSGDAWIGGTCSRHGWFENFYYRDAALYRALLAARNPVECCTALRCVHGEPCRQRETGSMIFIVNVTNRCNMTCEACFSGSGAALKEPFSPKEQLLAGLPDPSRFSFRPHAVFLGGEPTLHPELPDMIAEVTRRGYTARLATNGLRLRARRYAEELAAAGLRWIFLHFDSTDDRLNERLRGRPMLDECLQTIATCRAVGMKVQFGTTLSRENIGETVRLLQTAHREGVFWVSLYTLAEIERTGHIGATFLADALAAIEAQSGGQVKKRDFVTASRVWSKLHRLTGRLNFRQKPTMVSLPVVFSGGRMVPVTRFFDPLGAAGELDATARFVRSLPSLLDYEHRAPSGDTLVINVQQFQGRSAFDLDEATHSLMSFLHEGSIVPFDVFNHVHRYQHEPMISTERLRRAV